MPGSRILCIRGTQNRISESSLQILKDNITLMDAWDLFEASENQLKAKNGTEFIFYGAKTYQSFRSLQRITLVWIDEAEELSGEAWDVLIPTIRPFLPGDPEPRFLIKYNPQDGNEAVHKMFVEKHHPDAEEFEINYPENPYFPKTLRKEMELCKSTDLEKYEHIWLGKKKKQAEGALWKQGDILRSTMPNYFDAITIGLDPSGSANGDECGIVADGRVGDTIHTIEDVSIRGEPLEWAQAAINLYRVLKADRIAIESNFGGKMAETIIHQLDPMVEVKNIFASRGKLLRAEPVKALYNQRLVYHTKIFANLEYEMTTYRADPKQKSPNRLDAHVFAVTDLYQPVRRWGPA